MGHLPFTKALTTLKKYGISYASYKFIKNASDLKKLVYPIVLKVYDEQIIHKSDVGGVITGITTYEQAAETYAKMQKLTDKILAQGQHEGHELILGMKRDEQFGPVLMFGMGGIFVEVFKDVALRICPITKKEALAMIQETKAAQILQGARGQEKVDLGLIADLLVKLSKLSLKEDIKEIDLNPVIINKKGIYIVDQRLII